MTINLAQKSYIKLRSIIAERTSSVLFWVGSGISAHYDLPTWPELRNRLMAEFENKIKEFDEEGAKKKRKQLNEIKKVKNNWIAFERIETSIGKTTYKNTIYEALSKEKCNSKIYDIIWALRINGMISSNIDHLANQCFYNVYPNTRLIQFTGQKMKDYSYILNNPNKFLLKIHGNLDDRSTWVFTNKELKYLMDEEGYIKFINSTIMSKTIVFIGISANDMSTGGHISRLFEQGFSLSDHFWITDKRDLETDHWAESSGIQLIKYSSDNDKHTEILTLLYDLKNYVPIDDKAPPIYYDEPLSIKDEQINKKELMNESSEFIRLVLNDEVNKIFKINKDPYAEYFNFIEKHDELIHKAWYITLKEPNNVLLGYTLNEMIHAGNFGKIYKATDSDGNVVVIKVLLSDLRDREEFIQGFRRGIRSMRILNRNNIEGMAEIYEASEIPALIVMEWVDGSDLTEIVKHRKLISDLDFLRFTQKLTEIINKAHRLPERVLHRDIRPANIMVKWKNGRININNIVILDFDLSWHKTSIESKEIHFDRSNGYLAPEQISQIKNVTTRSAAVDSFGLGMTMFYILNKQDPVPSQHKHRDWLDTVYESSRSFFYHSKWKSLGNRIGRLVINCTKDKQSERWDFSQIFYELSRLSKSVNKPEEVLDGDLILEEIVARSDYKENYLWLDDELAVRIELINGKSIKIVSDESNRALIIEVNWDRKTTANIKNKILNVSYEIESTLSDFSFRINQNKSDCNGLYIIAEVEIDTINNDYDKYANLINFISKKLYIVSV